MFLEPNTKAIHLPGLLTPFIVNRVKYGNRYALRVEFQADDCYFIPGGNVAVSNGAKSPVIFGNEVFEVVVGGEATKNRHLCPKCGHLSLKPSGGTVEEAGFPAKFPALCTTKLCGYKALL